MLRNFIQKLTRFFTRREKVAEPWGVVNPWDLIIDSSFTETKTTMNILGKLPESVSGSGRLDWPGVLKILRTSIVTGIAAALGSLTLLLPGLDPIAGTTLDNTLIMLALIPAVEALRRTLADYSQPQQ